MLLPEYRCQVIFSKTPCHRKCVNGPLHGGPNSMRPAGQGGMLASPTQGVAVPSDLISNAKLIALLRRYMMEHAKSATRSICLCPICVEARRLLET